MIKSFRKQRVPPRQNIRIRSAADHDTFALIDPRIRIVFFAHKISFFILDHGSGGSDHDRSEIFRSRRSFSASGPCDRIDRYRARQDHRIFFFHVRGFGIVRDDDARIVRAFRKFQVRIFCHILFCHGIADHIGPRSFFYILPDYFSYILREYTSA